MSKDEMKAVLDGVLTWPKQRQQEAAEILTLMEAQDNSLLPLTDEQAAEVRKRLAAPSPDRISAEEVFKRFRPSRG